MKILVTGAEGYIGNQLVGLLSNRGHDVVGLDTGFYRDGWLYGDEPNHGHWMTMDVRDVQVEHLTGFDATVHLADLSNDPLGQMKPDTTFAINHHGTVEFAKRCKQAGISRFVYSSSCSVYGVGNDEVKTEKSQTNPQTAYAECKVLVERDLSQLADDDFSPTFMRNATAFGPSPRMRFDIVLNNLAGLAWTTGQIKMTSDGTPWRPLVHLLDIGEAMACVLEAPRESIHNEIFNVGNNQANYRVRDIAEIVADVFPGCELSLGSNNGDNRSYRVCFDKVHETLPDFKCARDARLGAEQLRSVFTEIEMTSEIFTFRAFTRLKQIEHLIATDQLNNNLCWQTGAHANTL